MKKFLILVEGLTEFNFVQQLLAEHLSQWECEIRPIIIKTKQSGAVTFKGGGSSYHKIKTDLNNLLRDSSAALVTTMFDVFGLPSDFPGRKQTTFQSNSLVQLIEENFKSDIGDKRFVPYLSLYDFEALLFSSPADIANAFPDKPVLSALERIRRQFSSPEDIDNDSPPAHRLVQLVEEYQKSTDGARIALSIGLDVIRSQCPHFNQWLTSLEAYARA